MADITDGRSPTSAGSRGVARPEPPSPALPSPPRPAHLHARVVLEEEEHHALVDGVEAVVHLAVEAGGQHGGKQAPGAPGQHVGGRRAHHDGGGQDVAHGVGVQHQRQQHLPAAPRASPGHPHGQRAHTQPGSPADRIARRAGQTRQVGGEAAAAAGKQGGKGGAGAGTGSRLSPRRFRHHIARPEEERRRQEGGPSATAGGLPGWAGSAVAPPRPRPEGTGPAAAPAGPAARGGSVRAGPGLRPRPSPLGPRHAEVATAALRGGGCRAAPSWCGGGLLGTT